MQELDERIERMHTAAIDRESRHVHEQFRAQRELAALKYKATDDASDFDKSAKEEVSPRWW